MIPLHFFLSKLKLSYDADFLENNLGPLHYTLI